MATKTETQVSEFKINYLTEDQYQEAVENGEINSNEIYMTPDSGSTHPTISTSTDTTSTSSPSHGGTFTAIDSITRDSNGHVTKVNTKTITLPSDNNTDTKVTNTLATTTKAYVTGTTSSSTNTGTQVFDTGVYLDTTAGQLTATTFKGDLSGNATTATKLKAARTFRTNLASTSTASFDGSANVTPGVTGTLPIANGGTGATTAANALSNLGLTATASELNTLDGITATVTELNYMDGVTSNVQTQLDAKAPKSHATSATTYGTGTSSNYGHVKLSDSTSTTSGASAGIAATPTAVKSAYDLANTANTTATSAKNTADTLYSNFLNIATSNFTDTLTGTLSSSNTEQQITLFTAPSTGLYIIDGYIEFDSNATGYRSARLQTQMGGTLCAPVSGALTRIAFNQTVYISKNTTITLSARQTSGSSLGYSARAKYSCILK